MRVIFYPEKKLWKDFNHRKVLTQFIGQRSLGEECGKDKAGFIKAFGVDLLTLSAAHNPI